MWANSKNIAPIVVAVFVRATDGSMGKEVEGFGGED